MSADLGKEGDNEYGDSRVKEVTSRWFGNESAARNFTGRYLLGTKDTLSTISFKADAKDINIDTGDYINISTRTNQDVTGASTSGQYCITEKKWSVPGHELQYLACKSWFQDQRYFYVASNSTLDYSSASDDEKERYGFISYDENNVLNGTFDTDLSHWYTAASGSSSWVAGGYVDIHRTLSSGVVFYQAVTLSRAYQWKIYIDIVSAPSGDTSVSIYNTSGAFLTKLSYGNSTGTGIYRTFPLQSVDIGIRCA